MKWPRAATTAGAVIETKPEKAPMPKELPPIETLRQLLDYDPANGILTWKPRPRDMFANNDLRICNTWNTRYAGKEALGSVDANGYKVGNLVSAPAKAHRIIWKLVHGDDPNGQIDHVNGVRHDNRIANLRLSDQCENQRNAGLRIDNKSGHAGVFISPTGKIIVHACGVYRGTFATIEEAVKARMAWEIKLGFTGAARKRKGRPSPPRS
jgi:hypothetical protein